MSIKRDLIRILWCCDHVAQTGFTRVTESIIKYLPKNKYEHFVLAVNYRGDPHNLPYKVYPASTLGDLYGLNRLPSLCNEIKPDIIYILNDAWIIKHYLEILKQIYKDKLPKIVIYFPVDAEDHNPDWYENFHLTTPVVYTQFGYKIAKLARDLDYKIISHGIDHEDFFKAGNATKEEVKRFVYPDRPDFFNNSFIVLNGNRNQPRKKLDITIRAFELFSKGKPENVKLYMHCGNTDAALNVSKYAERLGVDSRLIITGGDINGIQQISKEKLNLIYNATDVGLNTGLGEGFGLVNAEHACTGAVQIVPNHSALTELYSDCGLLVEPKLPWVSDNIMTTGYLVDAVDVANALETLYKNRDLYNNLSNKSIEKFNLQKFSWEHIAQIWDALFEEVLNDKSNVSSNN